MSLPAEADNAEADQRTIDTLVNEQGLPRELAESLVGVALDAAAKMNAEDVARTDRLAALLYRSINPMETRWEKLDDKVRDRWREGIILIESELEDEHAGLDDEDDVDETERGNSV